jgi:hypothetical protein
MLTNVVLPVPDSTPLLLYPFNVSLVLKGFLVLLLTPPG